MRISNYTSRNVIVIYIRILAGEEKAIGSDPRSTDSLPIKLDLITRFDAFYQCCVLNEGSELISLASEVYMSVIYVCPLCSE